MQSPINIIAPEPEDIGTTGQPFHIEYNFSKAVSTIVTTNGVEMVVNFLDYTGALKMIYNNSGAMVSFTPKHLSFRFPAEHTINGYRLDGEIILICDEIAPSNNKANTITNGLEFVIPVQFNPSAPEYEELNDLNPDMWRIELSSDNPAGATGTYRPKDPLTGKDGKFKLRSFFAKIMALRSDASMYMGTATTPPCLGKLIKNNLCNFYLYRPRITSNYQSSISHGKLPI